MPVKGRCHCGAIQFELAEAPTELTSCNCSFCVRRGALVAYYPPERFKVTTAPDRVSTYQWGTYVGSHHYCAICGIGTHSVFPNFETGKPDFDDAMSLPLPSVTRMMIKEAAERTKDPSRPKPFFRFKDRAMRPGVL